MKKFLFPLLGGCLLAALAGCGQLAQYEPPSARERAGGEVVSHTAAASAAAFDPPFPASEPVHAAVPATEPWQTPAPAWRPMAGRVVVLDPGHGGHNLGANYFGLVEKDIVLDLALRTAVRLRAAGINATLTRQTDVFVPLEERSAFANKHPNALFVSIHCNASGANPQASGVETFVLSPQFSDDEQCRKALARYSLTGKDKAESRGRLEALTRACRAQGPVLAAGLQNSLVQRLREKDRGVKTGNLAVLRETFFCPAVLVEVGFLSHYPTAQKMATPAWRDMTAQALADGVIEYLRRGG